MACAKPGADTSTFQVGIIVDSLQVVTGSVLRVEIRPRSSSPGYGNVSAEIQPVPNGPLQGTACLVGTGIVVRGPAEALRGATLYLDPPGPVQVWILNGEGKPIAVQLRIPGGPGSAVVGWGSRRGTT